MAVAKRPLVLEDLYRVREAADPHLDPDGRRVAFVATSVDSDADENQSSIWSVPSDAGEPAELTRGPHDSHPRWSPDGTQLAFLRRPADGPPQIWLLPSAGGEARKLTDLALGAGGFVWAPDGSRLAVLAPVDIEGEPETDEDKERRKHAPVVVRAAGFKADGTGLIGTKRMHLHIVDASTGEAEQLTKNDFNATTPAWSPNGTRIAFAGTTADRDVTARAGLYVVGPEGGEPEEIAHWQGTAVAPVFRPDGASIVFCGQERVGPGHARLFEVPADGGTPTQLLPSFDRNVMIGGPAYPGVPPVFTGDGRLLFCARDRGCTHIYALDGDHQTKIVGGVDRVASSVSVAGDRMVFVVSAPDIPSDVFVASTDGRDERRLTNLSRELIDEVSLRVAEPRTFTAPDGVEVHGWLVQGDGEGPRPLLLDVHGGPHNAWNPSFLPGAHLYQELLAEQGWSTLLLNPRGSDGYGEEFFTAVSGGWGLADEHDFLSALDTVVEEGLADPKRLAICGYSYGGYMTNWLTARTDRFAVAVSGGCVSNEVSMYGSSDLGFWIGVHEMGAELHEARERYAEVSPLSYVENVSAPTLLLHGENDDRCPVGQAEEWFVALRRRGIEVELVRYPGASHLFILNGRPSHRIDYSRRIVDWLTTHV
jgi:dipeptidyl aminopeptidase/acylaminoacyl peptidase